jgi:hypothetical protein
MNADLEQASLAMLAAAGDIIATAGEDHGSMEEIGRLMQDLSSPYGCRRPLAQLLAEPAGGGGTPGRHGVAPGR